VKKNYAAAINEALHQLMERDERVFQIGVGINTPWYVGSTMDGLLEKFGTARMIDTPVSENSVTGMAIGASICGLQPLLTFPRMDFMYYAMDQLCNHLSAMRRTLGGKLSMGLTVRAIINRGGEQGAQHSQAIQAIFQHVPGFRVVLPSTAYDAKGLLIAAVESNEPVIYVEDRWIYGREDEVPREYFSAPLEGAATIIEGCDVTVVASSHAVSLSREAAMILSKQGVSTEVIDLRSIKPVDVEWICASVKKTGKLIIVDATWRSGGVGAEIAAIVSEQCFDALRVPILRLSLPDDHAPSSRSLEEQYYIDTDAIVKAISRTVKHS
jgi:pyruvate dehydrogenase E1 component beta subunit